MGTCCGGGEPSEEWVGILDAKLKDVIEQRAGAAPKVKLLYSTEEHTYKEHVKPLVEQLDNLGISHEDQIEKFPDHSMIGLYFKDAISDFFVGNKVQQFVIY